MVLSTINPLYQTMNYRAPAYPIPSIPTSNSYGQVHPNYANVVKTDCYSPFHYADCFETPSAQTATVGHQQSQNFTPSCVYGTKSEQMPNTAQCVYYPNFNMSVHSAAPSYYQSSFSSVLTPMQEYPWMRSRQELVSVPSFASDSRSSGKSKKTFTVHYYCIFISLTVYRFFCSFLYFLSD